VATVQKWGNSLALRIPAAMAAQMEISEGCAVDMKVRDGLLVVCPFHRRKLSLRELLKDCKPSQLHCETDFGPDIGREVVE
jgi:antitoxin MazE